MGVVDIYIVKIVVTMWIIGIMVMIMMTSMTMTTTTMMWRRRRRKRSSNQCSGERSQCVTFGSWPSPGHAQTPTASLPTWDRMGWGIFSMSCLATPQTSPEFPNPCLVVLLFQIFRFCPRPRLLHPRFFNLLRRFTLTCGWDFQCTRSKRTMF